MHTTQKRRRRRRRRRASPARCLLGCLCMAILLSIYTALWATSDVETDDAQPRLRGVNRDRVAFLFLVRDQIPTAPIWKAFFDDADEQGARGLYKIYTHPRPGFTYAPSSLFYNTEVTNRTRVKWGAVTVARAEMRLIVSALRDPRTQRSILMSEAGVPLHPFWCLHTYLFSTDRSFVASWLTDQRRKVLYDFGVEDELYRTRWRKGHQWVALTREHMALLDAAQYEKFRKAHAMSSRAADFRREWRGPAKEADDTHHCFADEHFAATTLAVRGAEGEVVPASPTYISFGAYRPQQRRLLAPLDITQPMKRDWRATTYKPADITNELMNIARGRCRFSTDPAPLADAEASIRTPLSRVTAWAASERDARRECRFLPEDAPCYLMMRKIPKETVPTYLESYKNNLS